MNKSQRWNNKKRSRVNYRYSKNAAGQLSGKKKARGVQENPIANKIANGIIRRSESRIYNLIYRNLW